MRAARSVIAVILVLSSRCGFGWTDEPPATKSAEPTKLDAFGDPLPPGALARFGTIRFRHRAKAVEFLDKDTIVSVGSSIRIWDANSGKLIADRGSKEMGEPDCAAISANGKRAITLHKHHIIRVWDVSTGRIVREMRFDPQCKDREYPFFPEISVCADGSRFAITDRLIYQCQRGVAGPTWIVDVDSGSKLAKLQIGLRDVSALAISADGKYLVAGLGTHKDNWDTNQLVSVWDANNGRLLRTDNPGIGPIYRLEFIRGQESFVVAGRDVISLRTVDGKERWRIGGRNQLLENISVASDRVLVWSATNSNKRVGEILDAAAGYRISKLDYEGWCGQNSTLSPDGTKVAIADGERLGVLNLRDGTEIIPPNGHTLGVFSTSVSPDGRLIASASQNDRDIILWDVDQAREVRRFKGHNEGGRRVDFSPDGKFLASSSLDRSIRVWDVETGRPKATFDGFSPNLDPICFIERGKTLALAGTTVGGPDEVRVLEYPDGNEVLKHTFENNSSIKSLIRHPNGKILMVVASAIPKGSNQQSSANIEVWDELAGRPILQFVAPESCEMACRISPDGRTITTSTHDGTICLWELATGLERARFSDNGRIDEYGGLGPVHAFSMDGLTLACNSIEFHDVNLWDIPSGRRFASIHGHGGWVVTTEFTPDGRRLLTSSCDTTILSWDMTRPEWRSRPLSSNLSDADLATHWNRLRNATAEEAYRSKWALVGDPKKTVEFLRARLPSTTPISAEQIKTWVADLDANQFSAREKAQRQLHDHFDQTEGQLRRDLAKTTSAEVRNRINHIFNANLAAIPGPNMLRDLRANEVLEQIGSPEARDLLRRLANQPVATRTSRDAAESLKRLEARPR